MTKRWSVRVRNDRRLNYWVGGWVGLGGWKGEACWQRGIRDKELQGPREGEEEQESQRESKDRLSGAWDGALRPAIPMPPLPLSPQPSAMSPEHSH